MELMVIFFSKSPCFLNGYKLSAEYTQTLLVAREESSHPFLCGFNEFPKDLVTGSVLDGPSGDATHGSALVKSFQEKALFTYKHSYTTQPLYSLELCDTDPMAPVMEAGAYHGPASIPDRD